MTRNQMKGESSAQYWQREVDSAIDYYESTGKPTGPTVLTFNCDASDLSFAVEINGELHYRGRVLRPAPKVKQRKLRDVQQDIEG